MPNDEQNTWSTTQRRILEEQRNIPTNRVTDSFNNQAKFKVPVYADSAKVELDIFEIDIDTISYNFNNVRIGKYKKKQCRLHNIQELDPGNPEHQIIVQNILLNTKDYGQQTTTDLKSELIRVGQEDPALITESGVLWNGNRRCATMRELYSNPPTSGIGLLVNGRIKVCFLPAGLNPSLLRELEKRLQQTPDTKQGYGQMNEMVKCQTHLDNFDFETDIEHATEDEINEIKTEVSTRQFDTWTKIKQAKATVDLMDEYLESRDTDIRPLVGNYEVIEENKDVTWFDELRQLLDNVVAYYENPRNNGDSDDKYDAYKAMCFNVYDQGESHWEHIRKLKNTVGNASGAGTVKDTTVQLEAVEANSIIIREWDEFSQDPGRLLLNETRESNGEQVPIKELEHGNVKSNFRVMEQFGDDPKVILNDILAKLNSLISKDELILPNDQELVNMINDCRTVLQSIENITNST